MLESELHVHNVKYILTILSLEKISGHRLAQLILGRKVAGGKMTRTQVAIP